MTFGAASLTDEIVRAAAAGTEYERSRIVEVLKPPVRLMVAAWLGPTGKRAYGVDDVAAEILLMLTTELAEGLKRFLVHDGAGTDARFRKLAQSRSAARSTVSDERRWLAGVLGHKKGLGL